MDDPQAQRVQGLSSLERRLRWIIAALLSAPMVLIAGLGGIYDGVAALPDALDNSRWADLALHVLEIPVGTVCVVPPTLAAMHSIHQKVQRSIDRAGVWLEGADSALRRLFPDK